MSLARPQFFFSRNLTIYSTKVLPDAKVFLASTVKSSRFSPGVFKFIPSLNRNPHKPNLPSPSNVRKFGTFTPNRNVTSASVDIQAAAEAFKVHNPSPKGSPVNSARSVGYWLLGSAGLVFGIVILGGLTRLTESGLSITEWKPVTGFIPPLSQEDWQKEFNLYQNSPEFKLLNVNMTLEEFKFIYYMEWTHRLWGRIIGLGFVLPAIYFVAAKKTSLRTTRHLIGISLLIGLQGFIGWWMVKSGLKEEFLEEANSHPRVSQYRLAAHLGAALVLYMAMINSGLSILKEAKWVSNPVAAAKEIQLLKTPIARKFRKAAVGLTIFTFCTAITGAFVAGLDAGLIYNSFPMMGNGLTPNINELFDPAYASQPFSKFNMFWKNMLENPATVQLNHRIMAVTTFCLIGAAHVASIRYKRQLPRSTIKRGAAAFGLVTLQAALGITTLIYVVPTPIAALHQAGALALITSMLIFAHSLRIPRARVQWLIDMLVRQAKIKRPN